MQVQRYMHTNVFELTTIAQETAANRKLALPVDAKMLLYSRFKHVQGTPASAGASGLPLSRLRAIDNLIDRLIYLRGRNTYWVNTGEMNSDDLAFTVERLQKELGRLLSGEKLPLTAGSPQNDLGLVLNMVA